MESALYNAAIDGRHHDLCDQLMRSRNVDEIIRSLDQNNTILHVAAKSGKLLQINADDDDLLHFLYETNKQGNTPLHIAAKLGRVEMARVLVERARQTDVEQNKRLLSMKNNEQDTALHEAIRHNHLEVVKLLIQEDTSLASLVNGEGDSPLFMAVERGFYKVALHILNKVPNCSYQGRNGMNILHIAVFRSKRDFENFVLVVLEKLGALALEQADDFGWTPLHYAAHIGNEVLVKRFLNDEDSKKRLAYTRNKEGMSALHIAAREGNRAVIGVLMESCPEVCELLDNNGRTALHIAVESRQELAVEFLLKSLAFQDLINLKDNKGNTALHVAATLGYNFDMLRMLTNDSRIDKGAPNTENKTFVDLILSNEKLKDIEILEIMVALPPRFETKEDESSEKKKDEIQIEENEAGRKEPEKMEEESSEKKKDEIQVEENEAGRKEPEKMVLSVRDKKKPYKNGKSIESVTNVNLVIATIIVTATFAASFAMPGGYNDKGLAVLNESEEFKKFLEYDQSAFLLSAVSLLLHFFLPLFAKLFKLTFDSVVWASYFTGLSLIMMVFAFDEGIKTVIHRKGKPKFFDQDYMPGVPIWFCGYFLVLLCCPYLIRVFNKRYAPRNSVRSRFGLWS